jgi:cytochrome c553
MKMDYCKIKRKSVWSNALALLIAGAVLMMAPVSAWAIHLGGTTGHGGSTTYKTEDIRNTLHNLSGAGTSFNNPNIDSDTGGVQEVCVFCHTPHGGRTDTSDGTPPLWNRADPSTVYTMYSSVTFDGSASAPLGVSLACLSCHDGVMAMDALINYSGSGGFKGTTNTSRFQQLLLEGVEGTNFVEADGSMAETDRGTAGEANYETLVNGGGSPFPNLGVALTDDHPISIKICVDGTGSAFNDDQFDDVCNGSPHAAADSKVTYLAKTADTDLNTLPSKVRDRIRAYPSDSTGTGNSRFVECASCHNPHAPRPLFLRLPSVTASGPITANTPRTSLWGTGGATLDGTARWGDNPNAGSAVCLTCHEK